MQSYPQIASTRTLRVEAPDFSLGVTSDCTHTLDLIERYLLPSLPRAWSGVNALHRAPDVDIVLHRASRPDYFRMDVNGSTVTPSESMPYLFTLIQQTADNAVIQRLRNKVAIHAGTVVYQGKAIAVSGPSGSGKSRLIQELVRQGAEYASDEYAILDLQGRVHPYPRALMIRRDGDQQYPVLPSDLQATVREQPAPAALFLFLRYQQGMNGMEVEPLEASEFLIRLLKSTPQIMDDQPHLLGPLKATASLAKSYAGVRGEVPRAAAEILELAAAGLANAPLDDFA